MIGSDGAGYNNTSVQTGVGYSPPRSVNRPFCYLGMLKGRLSSIWVSYFALSRCAMCDCCNFHLGMNELIN